MNIKEYMNRAMSDKHMKGFDTDSESFEDFTIKLIESLDMDTLTEEQGDIVGDIFDVINYESGYELDEAAAKLKRTKPTEKRAHKAYYKKNKSKLKRAQKKYKRSAAGKKHTKLAKRMSKRGKTASGKRITRRS